MGGKSRPFTAKLLYVLFALFLATPAPAQPGRLNAQKIADGVWFLPGDASKGYCNNIVIEMRDYLIVVLSLIHILPSRRRTKKSPRTQRTMEARND